MTIDVDSTTDTKEAVTAALGDLAKKTGGVTQEAVAIAAPVTGGETAAPTEPTEPAESTDPANNEEDLEELETSGEKIGDEVGTDAKKNKPGGFKKRIDKLNQKLSQSEQEKDYWRQQALRAATPSGEKAENKAVETKPAAQAAGKPKADDFATHEEFVEALTDWKIEQRDQKKQADQINNDVRAEFQAKAIKHAERVDKFSATKDDWDEVEGVFGKTKGSLTLQDVVINSENGPEILYELGKNPKELQRILALPAFQQAKELWKIEARFAIPTKPVETKVTPKAPAPVTPVKTRGASFAKSIHDENISQREYEKLRAEPSRN